MRRILKKIVDFNLIKLSFFNSFSLVVKIVAGILSSKALAYFLGPSGLAVLGVKNPGVDKYTVMCDASFCGDSEITSKSQTGVMGCLNGVPIHWRSNRQPSTVLSPVVAEIYALSVGVIDARLMHWVFEECGVEAGKVKIGTDSQGAKSFKEDTCPTSKIRGNFNYRDDWVVELKEEGAVEVVKVEAKNMIADVMTKCYDTYKYKARVEQVRNMAGERASAATAAARVPIVGGTGNGDDARDARR